MRYTKFDIGSWPRKKAFEFYRKFDDPFFNVTAKLDVSALMALCRERRYSFFLACVHTCIKVANTIPNFKLRFDGDGLREYQRIHGGSTVLYDDESFGFAYYNYVDDLESFCSESELIIEELKANKSFEPSADREDLIYFSSLPWVAFTSIKHAYDRHINPGIPRISFGKYSYEDAKFNMPLNLEINHALADGLHVGKFFQALQTSLDESQDLLYSK